MSAKPDPFELLDAIVAIVRARNEVLMRGFTCANGSYAGSGEHSQPHTTPLSQTGSTTPRTGTSLSVLHTEDHWWTAQDRLNDEGAWARQYENDTDTADPKSYK